MPVATVSYAASVEAAAPRGACRRVILYFDARVYDYALLPRRQERARIPHAATPEPPTTKRRRDMTSTERVTALPILAAAGASRHDAPEITPASLSHLRDRG